MHRLRLFTVGVLLLILLPVHLLLALIFLAHGLLLFQARLPLFGCALLLLLRRPWLLAAGLLRRLSTLLVLLPHIGLPRSKVPLLLILLDHRVLPAIVLLLRRCFPVLMSCEPRRMVGRYPTRVLVVPPFAVMPLVLLIVGAILIEPP